MSDHLILTGIVEALGYLTHTCPTTKLATEKLAKVRAAIRALPGAAGGAKCHVCKDRGVYGDDRTGRTYCACPEGRRLSREADERGP